MNIILSVYALLNLQPSAFHTDYPDPGTAQLTVWGEGHFLNCLLYLVKFGAPATTEEQRHSWVQMRSEVAQSSNIAVEEMRSLWMNGDMT